MKSELKEFLKKVLLEKEIDKESFENIKKSYSFNLETKGYIAFIEGVMNYFKNSNDKINKNSIYGMLFQGKKEKLNEMTVFKFYDDDWIRGFKTALRDALEIISPNTQSINDCCHKTKKYNPT